MNKWEVCIGSIEIEDVEFKNNFVLQGFVFLCFLGLEKENFVCFDRPLKMTLLYRKKIANLIVGAQVFTQG